MMPRQLAADSPPKTPGKKPRPTGRASGAASSAGAASFCRPTTPIGLNSSGCGSSAGTDAWSLNASCRAGCPIDRGAPRNHRDPTTFGYRFWRVPPTCPASQCADSFPPCGERRTRRPTAADRPRLGLERLRIRRRQQAAVARQPAVVDETDLATLDRAHCKAAAGFTFRCAALPVLDPSAAGAPAVVLSVIGWSRDELARWPGGLVSQKLPPLSSVRASNSSRTAWPSGSKH